MKNKCTFRYFNTVSKHKGSATAVLCVSSVKTLKERLCLLTAESDREMARRADEEQADRESVLMRVKDSLNNIIAFCHRCCQNLDQQQIKVGSVCVCVCVCHSGRFSN